MSDWKKRNHEICIPGMDTPKTHICEVCGSKIVPRRENRYTAKSEPAKGGLGAAIGGQQETTYYDCFDCGVCGCQFVAQRRMEPATGDEEYKVGREIIEHLKMSFMIARYYSIKMKLLKHLNKMGDYLVRNKEGFEIQEANKTLNDIRRIIEGEIRR